mgnify:CR=1 FL=1
MIAAALAEQGVEVPDDLLPVDVWLPAQPYQQAFAVLSAARRQGMGGGEAIAYSEMVAYAQANGFAASMEDLEEFVMLMQVQDTAFLSAAAKARAK